MTIKNTLGFLLLLLLSMTLKAQIADLKTYLTLKDSFVAKYNRDDYKGIYQMASDNYKAGLSEQSFIDFLNQIKPAGQIKSSELIEDFGEEKLFKLTFEHATVQMNLSSANGSLFTSLGLTDFKNINTAYLPKLPNDNPLKNAMDSSIDRCIKRYFTDKRAVGLSIGLIRNGKIFYYNYGEVEKGTKRLPTQNTLYEIGSITKTFTGILLAQAISDKKIKPDDDIRKYLEGSYPNLEYKGQAIKIVNLANHTSRKSLGFPIILKNKTLMIH